ncbi:hypothetical protein D3C81_1097220 [compost metagenome]
MTTIINEAIRSNQVSPASVSISNICKMWWCSSMMLDAPLIVLAMCSMAATDSSMPIAAVLTNHDSRFNTAPSLRSLSLKLYRAKSASPNRSIKSMYSAKRRLM